MSTDPHSPNWSVTTKVFVAAFAFVIISLAIWRLQTIIGPLVIAGVIAPRQFDLDMSQIMQQVIAAVQPLMSQSAVFIGQVASYTASGIGWAIVIFVLSIYFAIDLPRFAGLISHAIYQPGYRRDVERILHEFGHIWNSYLRGQSTLAVLIAVIFSVTLWLLGVRYSLALGILAGVLEFIPYLGPAIIIGLTTLVAVFQSSNWLGLSPVWYGVIVLAAGLTIQQIDGNWLNPRVVGRALGLHPLLIIVGAIIGGTLAGILGVILAAPVLATLKLLSTYTWRKMFDLDPFPEPESSPLPGEAKPTTATGTTSTADAEIDIPTKPATLKGELSE
jgi:predicted PurR-regulated permease PerM